MTAGHRSPRPQLYFWLTRQVHPFVQDKGGDENFNVYAVNPADKPAQVRTFAAARNITDAKGIMSYDPARFPTRIPMLSTSASTTVTRLADLYKVKISTGERTLISENRDRTREWCRVTQTSSVLRRVPHRMAARRY